MTLAHFHPNHPSYPLHWNDMQRHFGSSQQRSMISQNLSLGMVQDIFSILEVHFAYVSPNAQNAQISGLLPLAHYRKFVNIILFLGMLDMLMTGRYGLLDNSDFAHVVVHYNANCQSFFTYRTNWIYFVQDDVLLALDKYSDNGFELVYKRIGFAFWGSTYHEVFFLIEIMFDFNYCGFFLQVMFCSFRSFQ